MKIFRAPAFISSAFVFLAVGLCVVPATSQKLTPADVVAKHTASIGSAEARARAKGTRIKGSVEVIVKEGGNGNSAGSVVLASRGSQNMVTMNFDAGEPTMSFRFDGSKTTVTQFRPGRHTPLEHFFAENEGIVGEGLVGGVLSESWPLLNLQEKNPKLEYSGAKKIGDRPVHAIKYRPRKGSELNITLFFDAETFQHVRTEYEKTFYSTAQQRIPGQPGRLPSAGEARGAPQRLTVYEAFSDFRTEGGLNLPHVYKFELSVQSNTRPLLLNWTFNLAEFTFNAPVDPSEFVVGNEAPKPN
ncbi:MAG TPA: hypothetical protein VFX97_10600 [Pyrinomonadaceae bacterium]|nr:hypothetical protein [Pyrinomonadaceae bacterium]